MTASPPQQLESKEEWQTVPDCRTGIKESLRRWRLGKSAYSGVMGVLGFGVGFFDCVGSGVLFMIGDGFFVVT